MDYRRNRPSSSPCPQDLILIIGQTIQPQVSTFLNKYGLASYFIDTLVNCSFEFHLLIKVLLVLLYRLVNVLSTRKRFW